MRVSTTSQLRPSPVRNGSGRFLHLISFQLMHLLPRRFCLRAQCRRYITMLSCLDDVSFDMRSASRLLLPLSIPASLQLCRNPHRLRPSHDIEICARHAYRSLLCIHGIGQGVKVVCHPQLFEKCGQIPCRCRVNGALCRGSGRCVLAWRDGHLRSLCLRAYNARCGVAPGNIVWLCVFAGRGGQSGRNRQSADSAGGDHLLR